MFIEKIGVVIELISEGEKPCGEMPIFRKFFHIGRLTLPGPAGVPCHGV
jgi:hypothetical protein